MMSVDDVFLANHLWQSTLFAGIVWLMTLMLRENRAAARHSLWLAASVKFLIPFSLLVAIGTQLQWLVSPPARVSMVMESLAQPFGTSGSSNVVVSSSSAATSLPSVLLFVWILGFLANILWWAVRWLQLRRSVRQATPVNLNVAIRTVVSRDRLEPGVFGIFRPVLLLPEGITDRLSSEQLQAVLAHELCHVRRRDNLTAAVHMFVEALFWFHPLVWWIKRRLIDEQERACDEEVLRLGGDPRVYAESILKICEFYLTSPSMCVSGITSSNLKKRIGDIMKNRVGRELSLTRSLLLIVVALAVLAGPVLFGVAGQTGRVESVSIAQEPRSSPQTAELRLPQGGLRGPGPTATQELRIGEVRVIGATVFNDDSIRATLGLVPGRVYDEMQLREGFKELRKLYGNRGHVNFLPTPTFTVDEQRKVVNLDININEGPQYTIKRIGFTGLTTIPEEVPGRELAIKEGAVFDASLLVLSLLRLNRLGLFEEIKEEDVQIRFPEDSKLDVDVRLKEKRP
jgi:beta-lactamase regulating signal transducer with metallopeptidase domain